MCVCVWLCVWKHLQRDVYLSTWLMEKHLMMSRIWHLHLVAERYGPCFRTYRQELRNLSVFNCRVLLFGCIYWLFIAYNHCLHIFSWDRARRVLTMFNIVPLRTRRALSLYTVYGDRALLVLYNTLLNSLFAPLPLSRWYLFGANFLHDKCKHVLMDT